MNVALLPLILISLLFLAVPFVLLIVLQVYLSKMEKDWPGLVLPILSGVVSGLVTIIDLFAFIGSGSLGWLIGLVLVNVPTFIFIMIYRSFHKKTAPKHEIDKMTIQDLG